LVDQQYVGATQSRQSSIASRLSSLRVAIVHDWFYTRGGAERVVEVLADIFPQADLYSLFARPETMSPGLRSRKLTTSWLQKIPFIHKFHRHTLMLHPSALEQFDFTGYDLVLSSTAGSVKGVLTPTSTLHLCYCYSPMRYIWDMYPAYTREMRPITRFVFAVTAHRLRLWDFIAASRVDEFACDSMFVASRIRKYYRRESTVIYPPVNVKSMQVGGSREDFYLAVGRFVNYKRFDLAIEACNQTKRLLKIIGEGPDFRRLQRLAGPTVEFLGAVPDAEKHRLLGRCRALLFPGEEDFGIVPVEAQAHGCPVIAYGAGGALETVKGLEDDDPAAGATGVFFNEPTAQSLGSAMLRFERRPECFDPSAIRAHAMRFDESVFRERFAEFVHDQIGRSCIGKGSSGRISKTAC
jgi:glycosyltransferase involved in cell wall biosynthesis